MNPYATRLHCDDRTRALPSRLPRHNRRGELSLLAIGEGGLNAFVANDASCIWETCSNVVGFQPRVARQDDFRAIAGRHHAEQMLYSEPMAADDRFPAEDRRIRRNPREQRIFVRIRGGLGVHGCQAILPRRPCGHISSSDFLSDIAAAESENGVNGRRPTKQSADVKSLTRNELRGISRFHWAFSISLARLPPLRRRRSIVPQTRARSIRHRKIP
jgi:hypothetical protein